MLCNGFTCRKIMVQSVYILNILTGQYICYVYELFVNILFRGRTSNIQKLTSALLAGKWHMDLHLVSQR